MSRENKQENGKRAARAPSLNCQGFCTELQEAQQGKQRNWKNAVHTQAGSFNIIGLTKEWYVNKNVLVLLK